ncbi:Hydrogen peroxide-inducible genes activator [Corynebacterium ciconiae DSM 44920]|uniref:LysR substrate-binding domain-containing protein n=1 Tax=Corynebacterium ciconiae TaxID=227319 RepID=UPI00037A64AC|nr:LysR substrate-binding domain-containing protein [Corynebacterium ciconiae]WKD61385.1 Hydrogen peroxide-inducible genes activator [Corynebacterium ciconiae DSM 44920]
MNNKDYRPTLAQLRTFVTIAEKRHFGTAAAKLNISQPSLSQALAALESGLGVQLIERSTRKVIVTPIGAKLLPYAKATLEQANSFLSQARGADGPLQGPLTIGIIPTAAPYLLPELLRLLQRDYPELEPRIVEDQTHHLEAMLRDGQIDCALLATPVNRGGLESYSLYDEHFVIAVNEDDDLAGRTDITLASLKQLQLLLLDDGHCLRDQIVDLCRMAKADPENQSSTFTRATSLTTVLQCVGAGFGSTLIPASAVPAEAGRQGVAIAHFAPSVTAQRTMRLVYRASSFRSEDFSALGEVITRAYQSTVDTSV